MPAPHAIPIASVASVASTRPPHDDPPGLPAPRARRRTARTARTARTGRRWRRLAVLAMVAAGAVAVAGALACPAGPARGAAVLPGLPTGAGLPEPPTGPALPAGHAGSAAPSRAPVRCLVPPVDAPVVDPYREPPCAYCAGNRGIEYGPAPGSRVVAVASGTVEFAGSVARTRWLVVRHGDGRRASYGHLASIDPAVATVGARVAAGARVGTTTARFYLGLRDGDRPVDPTPLLGRWRHRPRLVPVDGTPPRPPGRPRLVCPNAHPGR